VDFDVAHRLSRVRVLLVRYHLLAFRLLFSFEKISRTFNSVNFILLAFL
jgi:hypothetical protein